jgi:hypothetical protein
MLPGPLRAQDTVPLAPVRAALKLCAALPATTVALVGETVSEGVDAGGEDPQAPRRRRVAASAVGERTVMADLRVQERHFGRRQTYEKPHRAERDALEWRRDHA